VITVDRPLLVDGALVFRDGDDPDRFYALPAAPHFAATPTGDAAFSLLEYRGTDGAGGGFAQLEIELGLPSATSLSSVTGRPNATLSPVLFRSGDVSLMTIQGTGDSLVRAVMGSTVAALSPPFHTVFALDVTEEGAALLAQSATLPTAPIGVLYQLRFLAQTPALHAHVTMDYDRIYDHFSVSLGFTYYVNVRVDAEFSWLVEHGYVTVTITEYTDQADQLRQEQAVLDLVKARIEADFFSTGLPADPGDAGISGPLGAILSDQLGSQINSNSAMFTLKARVDIEKELKHFEIDYNGTTVEELTHVVSGFLGPMVAGASTAPTIRQITATDAFYATLDVATNVAVDWTGLPDLREAAVTLAYGDTVKTFVATPDSSGPYRFTCPLVAGRPDYTTHTEFNFDPSSTAGPATMSSPDAARHDRAFGVNSADAVQAIRVQLTSIAATADLVPEFRVNLRVAPASGGPDLVADTVALDAQHPQVDWYRRVGAAAGDVQVFARADWVDRSGTVHAGDETAVVGGGVLVRGPIEELLTVLVEPTVDWTKVTRLLVEFRHPVLDTVETPSLTFTPADGATGRTVTLALSDTRSRGYQWRATVTRTDGTSTTGEWADSDVAVLTVGDPTPPTSGVRIVWVGDAGGALAMRVDFWQTLPAGTEQQVASALLQPGQTDTTVTLPVDDGSTLAYRYEVHRIDAAGDTLVRAAQDVTRLLIVRTTG
jgi:hypothetical protein